MKSFPGYVAMEIEKARSNYENVHQQSHAVKEALVHLFHERRAGDDLNVKLLKTGETALHLLLRAGYLVCAELLIFDFHVRVDIPDMKELSARHLIVMYGHWDILKSLHCSFDQSLLVCAASRLNCKQDHKTTLDMITFLINKGACFCQGSIEYIKLRKRLITLKSQYVDAVDAELPLINNILDFIEKKYPKKNEEKLKEVAKKLRIGFR